MKYLVVTAAILMGFGSAWAETSELELEKELSRQYLEQVKNEPNTAEFENGVLIREVFKSTSDEQPLLNDKVTVMYKGYDREGNIFDSSWDRLEPVTFPLNKLISCWQTAITRMTVGSIYKVTCPSATAYGDKGAGNVIKGGAAISFEISLLKVED